jgi:UDP-N-acetylglucosamine--N-acetylmuramyl-(pentapeptide) pyrophosphoryl-undecaprenol N-acetylglucosamine transferase
VRCAEIKMKIILTGGGTGGHIYPALAIARGIKDRAPSADILYVGTQKGMESKIVPAAGINFRTIDVSGLDRSSLLKAGKSIMKFPLSFWQSRDIIKEFKPDIVIGTGGYVSYPVVLAATYFGARTLIHEQNAFPGLANRKLAKRVDCVMLTFGEAARLMDAKNIKTTGLPVRKQISEVNANKARAQLNFTADKFTLVAFGGSRGAASINRAMLEVVERYRDKEIQIIWITGETDYEEIKSRLSSAIKKPSPCKLHLLPYMYNIEEALGIADLAVCRAGASTLSELQILGLPAVLIPYPYATDNHQEKNARALLEKNAVKMVIDEFLDGDTLYEMIETLRIDRDGLQLMKENMRKQARPDALNDILDIIFSYAKGS